MTIMNGQNRDTLGDDFSSVVDLALPKRGASSVISPLAKTSSLGNSEPFVPKPLSAIAEASADSTGVDDNKGLAPAVSVGEENFEPGLGMASKAMSRHEVFLTEQAFAKGKEEGGAEVRDEAYGSGKEDGRALGYKEGFAAGMKERKGEIEERAQEISREYNDTRIAKIAHFLERLMQAELVASKRRDTELMRLMIAIFEKTLPALSATNGDSEVRFFIDSILRRFEHIPQITITLSDSSQDLVSRLRERVGKMLSSEHSVDDLVSFRFDSSFSQADCRIAWAEGEVERRFTDLWQEIKQALESHLPDELDLDDLQALSQDFSKEATQGLAQDGMRDNIGDEGEEGGDGNKESAIQSPPSSVPPSSASVSGSSG